MYLSIPCSACGPFLIASGCKSVRYIRHSATACTYVPDYADLHLTVTVTTVAEGPTGD